ncbi:hypothetical protein HII36_04620 [Nonomuraea sp. NN258]|uniref:hypothetical protein n=1 Tax=Nonomuraea antri TaxID=2730852 RepID=UPI00156A388D|nr:hypothetical protein [Nonomuraea antri]NRQ31119.1 hypothetical protein [Nonomuraea antri]
MIIRVCAVAAAGLVLFSGAAVADPVTGAPELTHNELYKAGKLPKVRCKVAKGTSRSSAAKYATKLVSCLNTAWKSKIKDFVPVEVKIKASDDKKACSSGMDIAGSFAEICFRAIEVRLAADWIKAKDDLAMFSAITKSWSGVVLGQTGIGQAYWALGSDGSESESREQTRRFSLQGDCLAGASMKSLGRVIKDWKPLVASVEPPEYGRFKWQGKQANRVYWFKQGYQAGGPAACNTWKASSAKVA